MHHHRTTALQLQRRVGTVVSSSIQQCQCTTEYRSILSSSQLSKLGKFLAKQDYSRRLRAQPPCAAAAPPPPPLPLLTFATTYYVRLNAVLLYIGLGKTYLLTYIHTLIHTYIQQGVSLSSPPPQLAFSSKSLATYKRVQLFGELGEPPNGQKYLQWWYIASCQTGQTARSGKEIKIEGAILLIGSTTEPPLYTYIRTIVHSTMYIHMIIVFQFQLSYAFYKYIR